MPRDRKLFSLLRRDAPRLGTAGSRSSDLHVDVPYDTPETTPGVPGTTDATGHSGSGPGTATGTGSGSLPTRGGRDGRSSTILTATVGTDLYDPHPDSALHSSAGRPPVTRALRYDELARFALVRWLGTVGSLLLAFGALGAGALPVVDNPYTHFPGGSIMGRMLQTSSMLCYVGVGCLVVAWLAMGPFVGVRLKGTEGPALLSPSLVRRTAAAWIAPIALSAPMFTQDIYSYLAQGSIVAHGMDPYAAGPVDILGVDHPLARSVPLIWSHSPSPYGPVALGIASVISRITGDSILFGILAHRAVSVVGVAAAGWAIYRLALRCRVGAQSALWLSLLNPLVLLHLVGGIHNEAIMLGFMLVGMEIGMRGVDCLRMNHLPRAALLLAASGVLISCGGLTKVTGLLALGFIGMWVARELHARGWRHTPAIATAACVQLVLLVATTLLISLGSGIGFGWVTGQGGAAAIRSWLSLTTATGVIAGFVGMLLQLGDHTDAILVVTRGAGLAVAGVFVVRMLLATYRGTIPPVGGLGVAMFVLVVFFPVVHPWYLLWAILPLAAFANRALFRTPAIAYSALVSLMVLPRGLALPPSTTLWIYSAALVTFALFMCAVWVLARRRGIIGVT